MSNIADGARDIIRRMIVRFLRLAVCVAAATMLGACANPFAPQYEYEEQVYVSVDGGATVSAFLRARLLERRMREREEELARIKAAAEPATIPAAYQRTPSAVTWAPNRASEKSSVPSGARLRVE